MVQKRTLDYLCGRRDQLKHEIGEKKKQIRNAEKYETHRIRGLKADLARLETERQELSTELQEQLKESQQKDSAIRPRKVVPTAKTYKK